MIVKQARNVAHGSSRNLIGYILGYQLGSKGVEQRESYEHLMGEAMARDDYGVGSVFFPFVGQNVRPSSILAYGVTSLGTADLEMTAIAKANPRSQTAVHHFILSFAGDLGITDETMHEATRRVLQKIGLGDHQVVQSVHRDTVTGIDPETGHQIGPVHIHVAAGAINPLTLLAWETRLSHKRIHKAAREVEIEMGLFHDRGLYVAREHSGQWRVEEASVSERKAWLREKVEHRREDLTRKTADQYSDFESPASWCQTVVCSRLRQLLDEADQRSEEYQACDLLVKALNFGLQIERDNYGNLVGRLRETIPDDEQTSVKLTGRDEHDDAPSRTARTRLSKAAPIPIAIEDIIGPRPEKRDLLTPSGNNPYILTPKQRKYYEHIRDEQSRYEKRLALIENLETLEQSEETFARFVRANPTYISRQIVTSGKSTFSRNDLDGYLSARITDADVIEELGEYIEQHDDTLHILSPDTANPLFCTKEHLATLNTVAAQIKAFDGRDSSMPPDVVRESIRVFEREQTFTLSVSQRLSLNAIATNKLAVISGEAGSGKTNLMQVLGLICKAKKRPMVGLATAQAAAERLLSELSSSDPNSALYDSGFDSINTMRAKFNQAMETVIKPNSVVVIDEAGMASYDGLNFVLSEALSKKGVKVVAIGDLAQLAAIEAGSPFSLLVGHAKKTGAYVELKEVFRQRGDLEWKRDNSRSMGVAIRDSNPDALKAAVLEMDKHKVFHACTNRTGTIDQGVTWYLENVKRFGVKETMLLASDLDTVRHINSRLRGFLIPADAERHVVKTREGVREFAVGERIIFKKNSKRTGFTNGDHGIVREFRHEGRDRHLVMIVECGGKRRTINPLTYDHLEWGYASTVHTAQGASVSACAAIVDKSCRPELLHVATSRSREMMAVYYATPNFADASAIAEHVADRLSVVDDALLFEAQVERYGGPDSTWARRVRQAQERDADPLRIQHRSVMAARKAEHDVALKALHAEFKGRTGPADSKAHKAAAKRISKTYAPESFVMWATKHSSEIVAEVQAAEIMPQHRRERDLAQQQARQHERDLAQRQSVEQPQRAVAPIQRAPEIERGSTIGW